MKWKSVWFWVIMQFSLQGLCCVAAILLRMDKRIGWLTQWACIFAVLYWQMRTSPLTGKRVILEQDAYKKWDIVKLSMAKEPAIVIRAIVIKKNVWPDGGISIRLFPYRHSRYRLLNVLKIVCIKVMVLVKCIK